jgi:hypothetical protein
VNRESHGHNPEIEKTEALLLQVPIKEDAGRETRLDVCPMYSEIIYIHTFTVRDLSVSRQSIGYLFLPDLAVCNKLLPSRSATDASVVLTRGQHVPP